MKKRAMVFLLVTLAGLIPGFVAFSQTRAKPLYSDDERVVLKYLEEGHLIPHLLTGSGMMGGEFYEESIHGPEIDRAIELFKSGSKQLRLAIARAIWFPEQERFLRVWDLCRADDDDIRFHLIGGGLYIVEGERWHELWRWLLTKIESDPKYESILLKSLTPNCLFKNLNGDEADAIIPLFKALYKKGGKFSVERGEGKQDNEVPCQKKVIELLRCTPAGRDLLLGWILSDSRKMDIETLKAAWHMFPERGVGDDTYITNLCAREDFLRTWLLCVPRVGASWQPEKGEHYMLFFQNLWRHLFDKDPQIRRATIHLLLRYPSYNPYPFLKSIRDNALLDTVLKEIREVVLELQTAEGTDPYRSSVREAIGKVGDELINALMDK